METDVVAENPEPPGYYRSFNPGHPFPLSPPRPPISSQGDGNDANAQESMLHGQYKGIISMQLKNRREFDGSKDYREELTSLTDRLVREALDLARQAPTNKLSFNEFKAKLQESVVEMHGVLSQYRKHMYRSQLIDYNKQMMIDIIALEEMYISKIKETQDKMGEINA